VLPLSLSNVWDNFASSEAAYWYDQAVIASNEEPLEVYPWADIMSEEDMRRDFPDTETSEVKGDRLFVLKVDLPPNPWGSEASAHEHFYLYDQTDTTFSFNVVV